MIDKDTMLVFSQHPTHARQRVWRSPLSFPPSPRDHEQMAHSSTMCCNTAGPLRVLPTPNVVDSLRFFHFCLAPLFTIRPWLRKRMNVKDGMSAARWCLNKSETHLFPCAKAMKTLQDKTTPKWITPAHISLLPLRLLAATLLLTISSSQMPNICVPLISSVQKYVSEVGC